MQLVDVITTPYSRSTVNRRRAVRFHYCPQPAFLEVDQDIIADTAAVGTYRLPTTKDREKDRKDFSPIIVIGMNKLLLISVIRNAYL